MTYYIAKLRKVFLALCICLVSVNVAIAQDSPLQTLHEALYDLYFPEIEQLTVAQKNARLEQQQQIWNFISTNKKLLPTLKKLYTDILYSAMQSHLTADNLQKAFARNMHVDDAQDVQLLFNVRKLYLSMIYNDQMASSLAGVIPAERVVRSNTLNPPNYILEMNDKQIRHKNGEIDYLIVGSGPAGSVIANELRAVKPDARIVILDAGSFVKPNTIDTTLDSEFMEMHNRRTTTSGAIILRNGEAIGGGTTVNIDLAFSPLLPSIQQKLNLWIEKDYIPYTFVHTKDHNWAVIAQAYSWVLGKLHTRDVSAEEINANNHLLLTGTSSATTYFLNQKNPDDHPFILKNSAVDMLLIPALLQVHGNGDLSILPNAYVQKVNFTGTADARQAHGVIFTTTAPVQQPYVIKDFDKLNLQPGVEYEIKANNIIVCAGALGSAGILLRSDIHNDHIGRGITIHPSMGVVGEFERIIDADKGLSASVYAPAVNLDSGYYFESLGEKPNFVALIHPGTGKEILSFVQNFRKLGGFGVMLIDTPNPDNRVFIDAMTKQLSVDYKISDADKERFKLALEQAVTILFAQGAKRVFIPSLELSLYSKSTVFTTKEDALKAITQLQFIENLNFVTSAHMQGSNKIGSDPHNSVVSNNFRVRDGIAGKEISNLYVVDSSIFPTSVGANPMQSIYTFAKIFVDRHVAGKEYASTKEH